MSTATEIIHAHEAAVRPLAAGNGHPTGMAVQGPAEPPSVEAMVMTAIERGTDPATLERLVALAERVNAQRAEKAFNEAMAGFQSQCPAIIKNRKGDKARYADLQEVTKVVNPPLFANGLSYSWDGDTAPDWVVVTCTVSHVAGHKRTAKFGCKPSGTSAQSPAMQTAGAVTYAKRQSLIMALGVTVDDDDDGRRPDPLPAPEPDPSAPRHQGRAAGYAPEPAADAPPADPNRVTAADLNKLWGQWRTTTFAAADPSAAAFARWAATALGTTTDMSKPAAWTVDAVDACREAMR